MLTADDSLELERAAVEKRRRELEEIDWDKKVLPEFVQYARTADPNSKDRAHPVRTPEEARRDLMTYLQKFLEHDLVSSRWKFENFLRDQTGELAHRANYRLG
ncbi:MAG: hypothetical protein ACPGN4_06050, partial [Miltoncostaeaceae bacterium]